MPPSAWQQLCFACENLLYPSETDSPVEPVRLSPPFPWEVAGAEVVEQDVHDFFAELTTCPHAAGFHALYGVLTGLLADLRVHRIGSVRVSVYVTGTPLEPDSFDGPDRYGVRTLSVET